MKASKYLSSTFAILAGACSVDASGEAVIDDKQAPQLVIESPARGAQLQEQYLVVRGQVTDLESGVDNLTINGSAVTVSADGSFEHFQELRPGITLLHTSAVDRAGNQVAETRAVLSGTMVPGTEPVQDAVVAHFTPATLTAITSRASLAADAYFASMAESDEPMFDVGVNCMGATGFLDSVSLQDVHIDGRYVTGGIEFDVRARGVNMVFDTEYDAFCLEGNTDVTVFADAVDATALVRIGLAAPGQLSVELAEFESAFTDLQIDVGIMDDGLIPEVEQAVADMLSEKTAEMVVPTVNALFEGMDTTTVVTVLGKDVRLEVRPTVVDFTPQGGLFKAKTQIQIIGQEALPYLSTPRPAPERPAHALGLALADDVFDQVFGPIWGAGLLEWSFDATGQLAALASVGADQLSVELRLPPTFSAASEGASPEIMLGGMELGFKRGETLLARVSVSARISVDLQVSNGALQILTGAQNLFLTKLEGSDEFGEREMNILRAFLRTALPEDMRSMLDGVPIPAQYGPLLNAPGLSVSGGYVFMGDDPLP